QLLAEHFWRHFLSPTYQISKPTRNGKQRRGHWNLETFLVPSGLMASVDVKGKTYMRIVACLIQLPALPEDD
ncbi:hypothetical protein M9458_022849, partial [Cirrhinus mrigala]